MTRRERAVFLREQLEQARADALDASSDFQHLTTLTASELDVLELDKAAQAVILAAAEVRLAARAVILHGRVRAA